MQNEKFFKSIKTIFLSQWCSSQLLILFSWNKTRKFFYIPIILRLWANHENFKYQIFCKKFTNYYKIESFEKNQKKSLENFLETYYNLSKFFWKTKSNKILLRTKIFIKSKIIICELISNITTFTWSKLKYKWNFILRKTLYFK